MVNRLSKEVVPLTAIVAGSLFGIQVVIVAGSLFDGVRTLMYADARQRLYCLSIGYALKLASYDASQAQELSVSLAPLRADGSRVRPD